MLLGLALVFALVSVATGQPIAVMSVEPNPGCVGQTITFDGSQSIAIGSYLVLYEWDFGGGGGYEATGATVVHVYTIPDDYYPGLRVTDNIGRTDATFMFLPIFGASGTECTTWGRIKAMYR
jgi:hypothetical protein